MAIFFDIPASLRQFCGGSAQISVPGPDTMFQALESISHEYPALFKRIAAPSGELYEYIGVFVNSDSVAGRSGRMVALNDGDVVTLIPAVAGG